VAALFGLPRSDSDERRLRGEAEALLAELGVDRYAHALPDTLPFALRKRVALARALAARPRALLLDEPLAALDVSVRREMRRFLAARLRAWPIPTVIVTHDRADAEALEGDIIVIESGAVTQRGRLADLSAAPATEFVRQLAG
jgi:ABC-type sulfate/molybdate transport systems ATPase subunit